MQLVHCQVSLTPPPPTHTHPPHPTTPHTLWGQCCGVWESLPSSVQFFGFVLLLLGFVLFLFFCVGFFLSPNLLLHAYSILISPEHQRTGFGLLLRFGFGFGMLLPAILMICLGSSELSMLISL